jgi:hypothetical protein
MGRSMTAVGTTVSDAGGVLRGFYDAVVRRDFVAARRFLADDLVFVGLFETYPSADAYLAALQGLMQIVVRLEVKALVAQGENAAIFFELDTTAPAEASTFVAEWHQIRQDRIVYARSAFDGRAFEAIFKK